MKDRIQSIAPSPQKISTMSACLDNRISQGKIFRPLSKIELSAKNRPKRLVEFTGNYGGYSYDAKFFQFETLSMADELVLLVCLSMISRFSRGRPLEPTANFGSEITGSNNEVQYANQKKILWLKLKIESSPTQNGDDCRLRDYSQEPVLMLETTPAELLRKLRRDGSGNQRDRLMRSLQRLELTTMRYSFDLPNSRYSFSSRLLAYSYTEPKHNTGSPSLRIVINHFAVHAITARSGGYTLHQVDEKIGLSELENAIHSQLCRLVTPAKAVGVRLEKLFADSYGPIPDGKNSRFYKRRFNDALQKLRQHLIEYGWTFGQRDETTIDVMRPASPKPEDFLKLQTQSSAMGMQLTHSNKSSGVSRSSPGI